MTAETASGIVNRGFCHKCHAVVPVQRVQRDNRLYLVRECPECGHDESLISSDARLYNEKREFMGYVGEAQKTCSLFCTDCRKHTPPRFVVVDVTNRCNMNCPICLANIPAMGMEFNPPLEYFDKLFAHLAALKPLPKVQFFGGEPTCREDLVELMKMARKRGLTVRVVTNGLKFADEDYCREVLNSRPQLMLGLDGVNPEIQKKLRKNPGSLEKKLKAIENIGKHSRSRITIMCTTAVGISEELLPDLLAMCFDKRETIGRMMLIPLQTTAGPEHLDEESTTIEDVEHIMAKVIPGTDFVPAGAMRMMESFMEFHGNNMTIGGSHPNCECFTLLVAEPKAGGYRPLSEYCRTTFKEMIRQLMEFDRAITPRLHRGLLGKMFGWKGRRLHFDLALGMFLLRNVRLDRVIGPRPYRTLLRAAWEKLRTGQRWKAIINKHLEGRSIFELIILPYEEPGCLESARLVDCPVSFACEHPQTGNVALIPFCSYFVFKNDILRKSSERWGIKRGNKVVPMHPVGHTDDSPEPVETGAGPNS